MLRCSATFLASLRYRRPYWMLFLKGVDNWKIYTVIQQADHQRTEMLYQAWLGGLDRPYVRPKCMAHQPVWLTKKRHLLRKARLQGPETHLEKFVLEWYQRFHSFQGTQRPSPDDLHTAFDLVERPLDLSYACQLLHQCRNHFNIRLGEDSLEIFLEACLRVGRKDCAEYALEQSSALGFWHVGDAVAKFIRGEQTWYKKSSLDGLYYPLQGNEELNARVAEELRSSRTEEAETATAPLTGEDTPRGSKELGRDRDPDSFESEKFIGTATASSSSFLEKDSGLGDTPGMPGSLKGEEKTTEESEEEELARLEEELRALEEEEARLSGVQGISKDT